jgi:hypothetical protein
MVRHDTDLYDLKIRAHGRTAVIDTTSNHLFWTPGTGGHAGRWIKADALKYGTHLRTPSGSSTAVVTGGWVPQQRDGWMWDLTIPGDNDHDFYVASAGSGKAYSEDAASVPVLVHNANFCGIKHVSPVDQDWATKGAHINLNNGREVSIFPDGAGDIGGRAWPVRAGIASDSEVQSTLGAIRSDSSLRNDLIAKAGSAMEKMNSNEWGMGTNRAAEMHFLIKALEKMGSL